MTPQMIPVPTGRDALLHEPSRSPLVSAKLNHDSTISIALANGYVRHLAELSDVDDAIQMLTGEAPRSS